MGSRFPQPDTDRLEISRGDWLLVKRRLTHGEQTDAFARLYLEGPDGQVHVNPLKVGMANVTAYLLDWSLTEQPIRGLSAEAMETVLRNLSPEDFREIRDAIAAHEEKQAAIRNAEKNGQAGVIESSAISPLPVAAAGDLTTSAN